MVALLDRKRFFDGVRIEPFGGRLSDEQVRGMNAILDGCPVGLPADHLAYCFATAFHETGRAMLPVIETQRVGEPRPSVTTAIARLEASWKAGRLSWVKEPYWRLDTAGLSWLGRGLPQLTHRSNYLKMEQHLGVPFTKDPELALDLDNAVAIMFCGMVNGMFTGKSLKTYFNAGIRDPYNARRIINSVEKASVVAGYFQAFAEALKAAAYDPSRSAPIPLSPIETRPLPPTSLPPSALPPVVHRPGALVRDTDGALAPPGAGGPDRLDEPAAPARPGFWTRFKAWANRTV